MEPESQSNGDGVDFVDAHAVQDDFRGIVTKRTTPNGNEGFAVNVLPKRHPPNFVEEVTAHFDDRFDASRFEDGEPVGVVFVDRDDPSIVFPIALWDTVAIVRPDDEERKQGGVAVVSRSGETIRLRGVGAIDVDPAYVVEVTKRYDRRDED